MKAVSLLAGMVNIVADYWAQQLQVKQNISSGGWSSRG